MNNQFLSSLIGSAAGAYGGGAGGFASAGMSQAQPGGAFGANTTGFGNFTLS
jgi:hypothetical protein